MLLGFMQGRLSPQVGGKIQAFPSDCWREEFPEAGRLGLRLMEWTLDHAGLAVNPLMTPQGREEIRALAARHGVAIPSLTGDCFMQAPFWKASDPAERAALLGELDAVLAACPAVGIGLVVVPVVDNGRIDQPSEDRALREALLARTPLLERSGIRVIFEIDLAPEPLAAWIADYPAHVFGVNYDTGNSAALGYDPAVEWACYGGRVLNVHIKDRRLGGTTVPLGEGGCDFQACFRAMRKAGYNGNFILQTARAADGDHAGALRKNMAFLQRFLNPSAQGRMERG